MSAYGPDAARRANQIALQTRAWQKQNPWGRTDGGLQVNAGISKEAYFASNSSKFWTRDLRTQTVSHQDRSLWGLLQTETAGNAPIEQARVDNLWRGSAPTKGMFTTSRLNEPTYNDPRGASFKPNDYQRYGFQFHYNPTTVAMSYTANPEFDITTFTSGIEAFNLLGPNVTQSTISFNIVLNRLQDMKYFSPGGFLYPNVQRSDWSGKFPRTTAEQNAIFRRGTMYDVEYFLRSVNGGVIQQAGHRNRNAFDGKTADLGFLTGIPVDLHFGNGMSYWVRVDAFSLNHIIFNERMVPLFTEMSVSCSRIPDYGGDTSTSSSKGASSSRRPNPSGAGRTAASFLQGPLMLDGR